MSTTSRTDSIAPPRFSVAVQSLVWLSMSGGVCPSSEIAAQVQAHATFLRRVMSPLVQAGIVVAREGRVGGYCLGRPPERITLGDVYTAVKTVPGEVTDCPESDEACRNRLAQLDAVLQTILEQAEDHAVDFLNRITIADLARKINPD